MATINSYLNFPGTAEAAFKLYESVFGGELLLVRYSDTPESGKVPEADKNKLMHASLKLSNGSTLMATDATEAMGQPLVRGNDTWLSVGVDSEEEAERIFKGLSEGGKITMPLAKTFWNAYFGMFVDAYGIQWMVNYDYNK